MSDYYLPLPEDKIFFVEVSHEGNLGWQTQMIHIGYHTYEEAAYVAAQKNQHNTRSQVKFTVNYLYVNPKLPEGEESEM